MDGEKVRARFNEFYAGAKESSRQRGLQNVQIKTRSELAALIDRLEFLNSAEKSLVIAALKFPRRKLTNVMTPADQISFVRDKVELTPKVIDQLYATGQKIFPIVHANLDDTVGVIFLEEIAEIARGEQSLQDAAHAKPPVSGASDSLISVLDLLLMHQSQVALVSDGHHIVGMLELGTILDLLLGE